MSGHASAASVAALLVLACASHSAAAPDAVVAGVQLEERTRAIFVQLRSLTHIAGPQPDLEITLDPLPAAVAQYSKVVVTRRLLRLCASVKPVPGTTQIETRDALIAFVLAHQLEHLARGDLGSFGSRSATGAVEKDADDKAAGRLVVAGIQVNPFQIADLLAMIGMESGGVTPVEARARARAVNGALQDIRSLSREWQVGWMLTVAGKFDRALDFYRNVAGRYPFAIPMYTLAVTRLQAAWRLHPCSDPLMLEWLPPLRYDPRTQALPFQVRGSDDACDALRHELGQVAAELERVDHPSAQITLASIRLLQGEEAATIDPTRPFGGVKGVGVPCPPPAGDRRSRHEADACHVSLLAQYEMNRRAPESLAVALEGLSRLREEWPSEPSLRYNLARLLSHARRPDDARPLWEEFLQSSGNALHRLEAETALRRSRGATLRVAVPETPSAPDAVTPAEGLRMSRRDCRSLRGWTTVASTPLLTYCGDWADEIGVADRSGILVRSVAVGSKAWPETSPPSSAPLFVTTNEQGEELRIWTWQAWVLEGTTPRRVVYFRNK